MLDPQAKALIEQLAAQGNPPLNQQTPTEARASRAVRTALSDGPSMAVESVTDIDMAQPDGPISLRHYRPLGSSVDQMLPAIMFFHGGGFVVGDLDSHDSVCRYLAAQSGCAVISVAYRLAPEHRFPAAFDDCIAATRYVVSHADALGVDTKRMAVAGDSAGGQLSTVVAIALRDDPAVTLAFQLLIYPITDPSMSHPSIQSNGKGYMLTESSLRYYYGHYFEGEAWREDWRAMPLREGARQNLLTGLPDCLVISAGFDPLRDEARAYADALSAAGVNTQYVCFERQIHGFVTMGGVVDEANLALDLCVSALKRSLRPDLGAGS
jgi:acetyl esterase